MNKEFFIKQLDEVIKEFEAIKARAKYGDLSGNTTTEEKATTITKAKAAVSRIAGRQSEYYMDVEAILARTNIHEGIKLKHIIGTVIALRSDLQNDYLKSLADIIQSEVFTDYLEMAEHLLTEGYKDASAVLVGSTLEVHLRELCNSVGIDIAFVNSKGVTVPKKADAMNSDLSKAGVYSSAYQKQVTAWLALRNSAAHGKYSEYTIEEVKLMLQGLRQFILTTK